MQRLVLLNQAGKLMLTAAFASLIFSQTIFGQTGQTRVSPARNGFEVASVKRNPGGDTKAFVQAVQGRLMITNLALRRLLLIAYDLQDYQLSGDPAWAGSERYDIQAKAYGNPSVREMQGPLLQVLLAGRFKLTLHRETRQLPIYELTIGRGVARLPRSREGSCTPNSVDLSPSSTAGDRRPNFCGFQPTAGGTLEGKGITMAALAATLSRTYVSQLGRNVVDATGLNGEYDVHLKWALDSLSAPNAPNTTTPSDVTAPSIFTALQEQMGLKLVSAKGAVEVLVIDHVEKPSAN